MAILKCKMCGGDLNVTEEVSVCECAYCGTKQTVPTADDEKKLNLFNRATRLRIGGEFDKAAALYESLVAEFPEEAEAYWGLVICHYGIEYVSDPATGRRIPTCHRASFDPVANNENFQMAMEYADVLAQKVYRDEAREIDRIREEILLVGKDEKPYDIFICYKESDDQGQRTVDSVMAQNVYDVLTDRGYRVFFARISLEDKLGSQYEPYIFSALNSARIMLVIGTEYDRFHAVWVKNEWSRFLKLMAKDKSKVLIPCYKDMDAYDMPDEFHALQAQDMGKVGAMQDLLRGIEKILGETKTAPQEAITVANNVTPLMERAFMFLEDGEWDKADQFCEQVLNQNPKCGEAYLGKLMAELRKTTREELKGCALPFDQYSNYQKAMRFGSETLQAELQGYVDSIVYRNTAVAYDVAVKEMESATGEQGYIKAAHLFSEIKDFQDAKAKAEECLKMAEAIHKERLYQQGCQSMCNRDERSLRLALQSFSSIPDWKDVAQLYEQCRQQLLEQEAAHKDMQYNACVHQMDRNTIESLSGALEGFRSISSWKDAAKLAQLCDERLTAMKRERDAEMRHLEKQRQKKRRKNTIILITITLLVLLGFFVLLPKICYHTGHYRVYVNVHNVKEFRVPNGVTKIKDGAFRNCDNLTCVHIPDSVTSIGERAFAGCGALESVTIPDSVTSIGEGAFSACISLESVTIGKGVRDVQDSDSTFSYCSALKKVTVNSAAVINAGTFQGMDSLTTVVIGEQVTSITDGAFRGCGSLTTVTIPVQVTTIDDDVFKNCPSLKEIYYSGTLAEWYTIDTAPLEGVRIHCSNGTIMGLT